MTEERARIIKDFIFEAVGNYQRESGTLPEQVVIYRDGMGGPSMTAKVQSFEVDLICDMLENTTQGYKPKIIYCLVDRNIQHRLFAKQNQDCLNPGPGTVVDTALVEY